MIRRGGVTDIPGGFGAAKNKVSHIYSTLQARFNYGSDISQLRVLASHNRKFEVCSSRRLGIRILGN